MVPCSVVATGLLLEGVATMLHRLHQPLLQQLVLMVAARGGMTAGRDLRSVCSREMQQMRMWRI